MLSDGTLIHGYTLSYLTAGGMGVIYRGKKGGRDYVLKEVPAGQPKWVLALTQEKSLLERINHPQIVHFVALFEEAGYYYLVCDFIDGKPLDQVYHQQNPISEAQLRDYGIQLCGIFAYLHGLTPPIIYRDAKPANILLKEGRVFLIDFGIARLHKGDRASDTEAWGSFTASPEHYGAGETDQRSDVFTLGATLYDLAVHQSQRSEKPDRLPLLRHIRPEMSRELEAILARAMARLPQARYQSMTEFRDALGANDPCQDTTELAQRPQLSEPEPAPVAPVPAPAPTRSRALAWSGLALAGLLALVFWAWPRQGPLPGEEPDTGLPDNLFSQYQDPDKSTVITLGSDIGLFRICSGCVLATEEKTRRIVDRLNQFYHERCPTCGHMRLEIEGFRVGQYQDPESGLETTVVFYSHQEPPPLNKYQAPILLATVEETEARRQQTTRKYVAAYWRDLVGDLVRISRGQEGSRSPLGPELRDEMLRVRQKLSPEANGFEGIHTVMQEIGAAKARRLQHLFENVPPDYKFRGDQFQGIPNYRPLL